MLSFKKTPSSKHDKSKLLISTESSPLGYLSIGLAKSFARHSLVKQATSAKLLSFLKTEYTSCFDFNNLIKFERN